MVEDEVLSGLKVKAGTCLGADANALKSECELLPRNTDSPRAKARTLIA